MARKMVKLSFKMSPKSSLHIYTQSYSEMRDVVMLSATDYLLSLYVSGRFIWDSTVLSQKLWSSGRTRWLTQRKWWQCGTG